MTPRSARARRRTGRARTGPALLLVGCALAGYGIADAQTAAAGVGVRFTSGTRLAPGVEYRDFDVPASHGTAWGHLLTVDLDNSRVTVDLLHPGAVAARAPVSRLADAEGAVGAVNGDFFNMTETQHPGVEATGAAVGPQIASRRELKAAVPDGQRFGPTPPPGTSAEDVLGVGTDHIARLDRLRLSGTVTTDRGKVPLRGLNQYALPVDGIGAFTHAWGEASRERAVCGTDRERGAPCSTWTYEVTVRHGEVVAAGTEPGRGPIPAGTVVLVGRGDGAQTLGQLRIGDPVSVEWGLVATERVPLAFAVGGFPILRDDHLLDGLDDTVAATRTAAGFGDGGHRLYLLALDGSAENGSGLTLGELAALMRDIGADAAVDLDGGGSSTLVARAPGSAHATVRNHTSGGAERPVPNAIGVFSDA